MASSASPLSSNVRWAAHAQNSTHAMNYSIRPQVLLTIAKEQHAEVTDSLKASGFAPRLEPTWLECAAAVASASPPAAWLIAADRVNTDCLRIVQSLHFRNKLVPTAVLLERLDPGLVAAAWRLGQLGVQSLLVDAGLPAAVRELATSQTAHTLRYLRASLGYSSKLVDHLFTLLATVPAASTMTTGEIAQRLDTTRSALYKALKTEGLPGVEDIQFLFRLLPALESLERSGNAERATALARFSDPAAFRKSVKLRFGMSLRDVQHCGGMEVWVDRWIALHTCAGMTNRV